MIIDYATPADRLRPRRDPWQYLHERRISVLRHGFTPSRACDTDVRRTWRRWCAETGHPPPPFLLCESEQPTTTEPLPACLRRQAM